MNPEKCEAVFRKDHAQNKKLKRDHDRALGIAGDTAVFAGF
jgi:hypothetical protein